MIMANPSYPRAKTLLSRLRLNSETSAQVGMLRELDLAISDRLERLESGSANRSLDHLQLEWLRSGILLIPLPIQLRAVALEHLPAEIRTTDH
jgi:hypothetical protein